MRLLGLEHYTPPNINLKVKLFYCKVMWISLSINFKSHRRYRIKSSNIKLVYSVLSVIYNVSASKHSVTDKQLSFCYDISNLYFEVLFMLMCKTAAFRQFI